MVGSAARCGTAGQFGNQAVDKIRMALQLGEGGLANRAAVRLACQSDQFPEVAARVERRNTREIFLVPLRGRAHLAADARDLSARADEQCIANEPATDCQVQCAERGPCGHHERQRPTHWQTRIQAQEHQHHGQHGKHVDR